MEEISFRIQEIMNGLKKIAGSRTVIVAFSGGMDSTVVLSLAKRALGADLLSAVHVDFGAYTYCKTRKNREKISELLQVKLISLSGESEQTVMMRGGPDCNLCTKKIKLGLIRKYAPHQIILTGSNQSDSWGKYGSVFYEGFYAPLLHCSKDEIIRIANYLNITIQRIGENRFREGCKLKHLLKPLVNPQYHGEAVNHSNEQLLEQMCKKGIKAQIANVKIIGPLNQNIALVNIYPLPRRDLIEEICSQIGKIDTIDKCEIVDQPLELTIKANKGQFNNMRSRYWIEKGRLQPEFAFPIKCRWLLTTNRRLKTFQVINYNKG